MVIYYGSSKKLVTQWEYLIISLLDYEFLHMVVTSVPSTIPSLEKIFNFYLLNNEWIPLGQLKHDYFVWHNFYTPFSISTAFCVKFYF